MIRLTDEWTRGPAARAVPGSYWDGDEQAWVLGDIEDITPRAAAVALQLFPGLAVEYPDLVELREQLIRDVHPIDYATPYWEHARNVIPEFAPRVRREMILRGMDWREHQQIDGTYYCALLEKHGGAYCGWDRGLGKTLLAAGVIDQLKLHASLIVAPNSAKGTVWADELSWAMPFADVLVLPNDKRKRELLLGSLKQRSRESKPFVLVVHYEALGLIAGKRKRSSGSTEVLDGWRKLGVEWDIKILDEGHRVSNTKAIQTRAAYKVPAKRRLLLSGSTFQNEWEELFGQLKFLFPTIYRNKRTDFTDRFLDYVENGYSRTCVGILPERVGQLQDELGRLGTWRRKVNHAVEDTVLVDLSPEQRRVYDELADTLLARLPDDEYVKASTGVALLTRLRQVASGLDNLSRRVADSSKIDAACSVIGRYGAEGDDFVCFVWYKETARALAERLEGTEYEAFVIHGDVKRADRDDYIRRFTKGEKRVLIGSIATMGESVNLQRANHVIMLDHSWNPALNQQAVDRVDRQGQKRSVRLTRIIARDTVDALVVMPKLMNKLALRAALFGRS